MYLLPQVTDALEYLHEKQHLVHNDLRCSNILVFRFPDAGHTCHGMGTRSVFQCEACTLGGVLVKLTDLGICVNPRAYRNKMNQLQRFIPECAEDGDLFTDKVNDISILLVLVSVSRCMYMYVLFVVSCKCNYACHIYMYKYLYIHSDMCLHTCISLCACIYIYNYIHNYIIHVCTCLCVPFGR